MENQSIASDMKISELKQGSLCKSYQELHSQASSMLVFSLQWKDLESHFDSTRKSLQAGLETLSEREKAVALREEELGARESRFESDFESKTKQLERVEGLLAERTKEIDFAKRHVDSLQALIVENSEELEVKEMEFKAIEKSVVEKGCEFNRIRGCVAEEEANLEGVQSRHKEIEVKLSSLEKKIKLKSEEAESKEKDANSIWRLMREYKNDLVLEHEKFNDIQRNVEERKKEVKLKEEQLRILQSSIEEFDWKIKLNEDKFNALRSSVEKCSNELESKEKRLDFLQKDLELKGKNLVSLKNSVNQCARLFKRREREIEGLLKELESKEISIGSKIEEVNVIYIKVNDSLKEVESREKNFESLQKVVESLYKDLETKEREFTKRVIQFESKQEKSDSLQKPTEGRAVETTAVTVPDSEVKIEQLEYAKINNALVSSSASNQNPLANEGKDLQLLLNLHMKTHDSVCSEVFSILKESKNPAKLVLDAMDGFYPSNSIGESSEFHVNIVRRSCILLLEQLMEVSPQIDPQVKEEAMKLAIDWRAKMHANYLEALGFLQFLSSFGLTSSFDPNQLYQLVDVVGQHRPSPELRQALSTTDKALVKPQIEQAAENSLASIMTRHPDLQYSTMANVLSILETSPDPAKYVLEYIHGPFSEPWKTGGLCVDANVLKNCNILFYQLFKFSPRIKPLVREDAMRVAMDWKANIETNSENSFNSLVFLQFLNTYGLFPSFENDEVLKLLKNVFRDDEVLETCCTVSLAKKMVELIQYLLQRKKVVDAIPLICAFKLADTFQPAKLLTNFMADLKESTTKNSKGKKHFEEKQKIADDEIAALEAVRECVTKFKLDFLNFPLGQINKRVHQLGQIKIQRRRDVLGPKAEAEERHHHGEHQTPRQPWRKRARDGLPHQGLTLQGRDKFTRMYPPSDRPSFPTPPPGYASNPSETALLVQPLGRDPRQYYERWH